MGVSRYFIERWIPVLGTGPATVVNTLRQLDYRCHGDEITISGDALAKEAAISRRYLYTCLETRWMNAFVRADSGERVRDEAGKISQLPNRYYVRMDDPLNPADADHLITVLTHLADDPIDAVQRALELTPRSLWAADPKQTPIRFTEPRALTAKDVLQRAFPTYTQTEEFALAAENLHRHVTLVRMDGKTSKVIVPQYFRQRWWKHLGADLAWSYLWLRGCVYDNSEEQIRRDTCWIPALNTLLDIIGRPREWWRRNVEIATTSPIHDFFKQLDSQKGRNPAQPQLVARQFWVALDLPIAPEDRNFYAELQRLWPDTDGLPPRSATPVHTGEDQGMPHSDTPETEGSAIVVHTGEEGVCHIETQGSATPVHSIKESFIEAQSNDQKHFSSSKHPENFAAAANKKISLFEELIDSFEKTPEKPLYQIVGIQTWLEQAWPEPILPHTPAWTLTTNGQVSPRDLVALILAVWADATIKQPPRYLSWLIQRWQTLPDVPPVEHWDQWRSLAELPLGKWLDEGRRQWIELAAAEKRDLPFGMETLRIEDIPDFAAPPEEKTTAPIQRIEPVGLDEKVGSGMLSMGDIWDLTLHQLQNQLNPANYSLWVEGIQVVSYADGVLTLQPRNVAARDWLIQRLQHPMEWILSSSAQRTITIQYVLAGE
jgi:hypothetical protein